MCGTAHAAAAGARDAETVPGPALRHSAVRSCAAHVGAALELGAVPGDVAKGGRTGKQKGSWTGEG